MTTRNWTKLKRPTPPSEPGQMRITLEKNQVLTINRAAFLAFRSPSLVEMFYDEAAGLIGIVPARIGSEDGYTVRNRGVGRGRCVTMKRFCTRFGLNPGRTIVFRNPTFDPDGMLVLNYRKALAESPVSRGAAELQSEQPEPGHPSQPQPVHPCPPVGTASDMDEWSGFRT